MPVSNRRCTLSFHQTNGRDQHAREGVESVLNKGRCESQTECLLVYVSCSSDFDKNYPNDVMRVFHTLNPFPYEAKYCLSTFTFDQNIASHVLLFAWSVNFKGLTL